MSGPGPSSQEDPRLTVKFCEGKYGGIAHGGVLPLGIHLPEHINAWTGIFIIWCGLHMLLSWQHDDLTLKVIAAHFCLNGGASFLYHWTGYDAVLAIDGFTMMFARFPSSNAHGRPCWLLLSRCRHWLLLRAQLVLSCYRRMPQTGSVAGTPSGSPQASCLRS